MKQFSFKPFQGFLPVSSYRLYYSAAGELMGFKPFQGFLPVSSDNTLNLPLILSRFQTLPGLLTGFFILGFLNN